MPAEAPDATKCHGWIPQAKHLQDFRSALMDLPDTTEQLFRHALTFDAAFVDLFTDGSCLRPHDSHTRLATWGVVIWDGTTFCPLASGGVRGWRQRSLRAEITAALSALKFLASQSSLGRLWVDNQQVLF